MSATLAHSTLISGMTKVFARLLKVCKTGDVSMQHFATMYCRLLFDVKHLEGCRGRANLAFMLFVRA